MLFSYSTSQGEPQASSVGFSCSHERIEQRLPNTGRYAGTVVQDRDIDPFIDFRKMGLYLGHAS